MLNLVLDGIVPVLSSLSQLNRSKRISALFLPLFSSPLFRGNSLFMVVVLTSERCSCSFVLLLPFTLFSFTLRFFGSIHRVGFLSTRLANCIDVNYQISSRSIYVNRFVVDAVVDIYTLNKCTTMYSQMIELRI